MRAKSDFIRLSVIIEATTNCARTGLGLHWQPHRLLRTPVNEHNEKENVVKERQQERKVNKVLILRFAFTPGKLNLIFRKKTQNAT